MVRTFIYANGVTASIPEIKIPFILSYILVFLVKNSQDEYLQEWHPYLLLPDMLRFANSYDTTIIAVMSTIYIRFLMFCYLVMKQLHCIKTLLEPMLNVKFKLNVKFNVKC